MNYDDPITCLKGIGEKTAALYEKLGIVTIGDLCVITPEAMNDLNHRSRSRAAAVMDFAAVRVVICSYPTIKRVHNLSIINTKVRDEEGSELSCYLVSDNLFGKRASSRRVVCASRKAFRKW